MTTGATVLSSPLPLFTAPLLHIEVLKTAAFPSGREGDDGDMVAQWGLAGWKPLETIDYKNPQKLAIAYGLVVRKFILSLDKGMGKTMTYLSTILIGGGQRKFIILCSNNAKLVQERELLKHFRNWGLKYAFVEGNTKEKRAKLWQDPTIDIHIATCATFQADMGARTISKKTQKVGSRVIPDSIANGPKIIDEYHKVLRRKTSGMFSLLKSLDNPWLILSSGSAGGKGPQDMWAALHLCNPKKFSSYWNYVNRFCNVEESRFGRHVSDVKNIEEWRRFISSNCFHRRKDLKDYPPKTRSALICEMPSWQKKIHDQLRNELWAVWKDEGGQNKMVITPNTLAATMKIRQFLVCPKILDPSLGYGAGLEAIWEDVDESELSHWVISTPFRAGIPYISRFFVDKGHEGEVFAGGTFANADEMRQAIDRWTKKGGPAIQTIKFAESYELPAARIMYMLGYEYSADENSQAEDRIHRDIRVTPHPVDIYYVKNNFSYDGQLIEMMASGADTNYAMLNKPIEEIFQ